MRCRVKVTAFASLRGENDIIVSLRQLRTAAGGWSFTTTRLTWRSISTHSANGQLNATASRTVIVVRRVIAATWFSLFARKPRVAPPGLLWPISGRVVLWAVASVVATGATLALLDAWAITQATQLPKWLWSLFREITDLGLSGWFLFPIGFLLLGIAGANAWGISRSASLLLTSIALRLSFLFVAIGLPGLCVGIAKRLIGRARPLRNGVLDPFAYTWPNWHNDYASLPSGHSANAFAAAFAIGALWPRSRPLMWSYAVLIAVSRVIVVEHHPSDVIAGAIVGGIGALLVRDWFAARRLVFTVGADGVVRPWPGPSLQRIRRVLCHTPAARRQRVGGF